MDWEKAKNILIVLFLVLNIFLSYNLIREKWSPTVSDEQIQSAESIIKARGITLNANIPSYGGNSSRLAFEGTAGFDMEKVTARLLGTDKADITNNSLLINGDKQISIENMYTFIYTNKSPQVDVNINSSKDIEKYAIKFLSEAGIPTGSFQPDKTDRLSDTVKVRFVQKKGNYMIFKNFIEVTISNKGVSQLKCSLQTSSAQNIGEHIMPAYKVLLKNLPQLEGVVISSIDLGYNINNTSDEMTSHTERLNWRVRLEQGQELFYDAVSGEPA